MQYFFALKSFIAPIIFLAVFGSTLHKAGGTISHSTVITQGTTLRGSTLAWAFFASKNALHIISGFPLTKVSRADLNGVLGNYATLGLNIADFARYANKPSAQNVQAFVIPFIFSEVPVVHSHVGFANDLDS